MVEKINSVLVMDPLEKCSYRMDLMTNQTEGQSDDRLNNDMG